METFGQKIKKLREEAGLTQAALAAKSGVSTKTLSLWENDEVSESIQGVKLYRVAKALNIGVETLKNAKISQTVGDPVRRGIPIINKAPAGKVTDYQECSMADSGQGHWYIHRDGIEDPHAFAVIITGDSMEPTFGNGTICVFSPMDMDGHTHFRRIKVTEGHIIFVRFSPDSRLDGCTIARWYRKGEKIELRKDNRKHKPIMTAMDEINQMAALVRYDPLAGVTAMFAGKEQNASFGEADTQIEGQVHPEY